jgi:hypothetical protein
MSEHRYAPCGLDCAQCDMFIATRADSDEMRSEVAEKWSRIFHYPFTKDDINCDGCLGGGRMGIYCKTMCEIRPCAVGRNLTDCRDCPDYECPTLRRNREASSQYQP